MCLEWDYFSYFQPIIPQSPATSSVPTPGTLNVQSPASIPNPASVGPPAASPAPLSAAEEQAYLEKVSKVTLSMAIGSKTCC